MKTYNLATIILCLFSCKEDSFHQTPYNSKLYGSVIDGNVGDTIMLVNKMKKINEIILLNDKAEFEFETHDLNSDIFLAYQNQYISMPLFSGFNINIKFHADSLQESLIINGAGSNEINASKELEKYDINSFDRIYYGILHNYSEEEFISIMRELYNDKIRILDRVKSGNKSFYNYYHNNIYYSYLSNLYYFESAVKQFGPNKNFSVSENYPNVLDSINIYDTTALDCPNFLDLVTNKIYAAIDKNQDFNSVSFEQSFYNALDSFNFDNLTTITIVRNRIPLSINNETISIESLCKRLKSYNLLEEDISLIDSLYVKKVKLQRGNKCPDFEFIGIDNKSYTLDSFQGKNVVFDFWASWCLPCIEEFPHIENLKNQYKKENIEFISVNCRVTDTDTKANWISSLEELQLNGFNLYASEYGKSEFFQKVGIKGLPHFVIINENGEIYESNASRPSLGRMGLLIEELVNSDN